MGVTWAIARHMIAESVRMKISLVFLVLLAVAVLGLPFAVEGDASLTGAVQSFLSYGLRATGFLLALLTIFLSRTMADDIANRQIQVLMAKPIPRWQYVLGKWLGLCMLNVIFLGFSGVVIAGMVYYLRATHEPIDEMDRPRLMNEVLVARHTSSMELPDFGKYGREEYQRRLEEGFYDDVVGLEAEDEKQRLAKRAEIRWRTVSPYEGRRLHFENILCDRNPEDRIQIRYKAEVYNFPPDEVFRAVWQVGNAQKGTPVYEVPIRHVVGRFHTIRVPADAVAPDNTLDVEFYNINPYEGEPQFLNLIEFSQRDGVDVYFTVGGFAGNFLRTLLLMLAKLMFLAAVALCATTMFSYPVACLVSFTVYALAATRQFLMESLDWASAAGATWHSSVKEFFVHLVGWTYEFGGRVIPDFQHFDGIENLVNGNNVPLMWVLQGGFAVVVLRVGVVLGLAILVFQRREVAETSL
jgi:hypothetical protein